MTGAQMRLVDERVFLARWYLGASIWAELVGEADHAEFYAQRANVIDAELRRVMGR